MTYAGFLALFVLAPLLLAAGLRRRELGAVARPLLLLLGIVYAATTPWDAAAVARGIWVFDDARLLGPRLWGLPLEELAFFGLQTALVALLAHRRLLRAGGQP